MPPNTSSSSKHRWYKQLMTRYCILVATLLFAACGGAPAVGGSIEPTDSTPKAADPSEDADIILTFAWPERIEALVHTERHKRGRATEGSYTLVSTSEGASRLVRFKDFQLHGVDDAQAQRASALANIMPAFTIDGTGQFASLENPDTLLANIRGMIAEVGADLPMDVLNRMFSKELLESSAMGWWNERVGALAPSTVLKRDETFTTKITTASPLVVGTPVDMEVRMRWLGYTDCPGARCVLIEITAVPDATQQSGMVEAFIAQMSTMDESIDLPEITKASLLIRILLTTEAETLLPHRLEKEKHIDLTLSTPEGEQVATDVQREVQTFEYLVR